jgi:regulator of replication initiation timing
MKKLDTETTDMRDQLIRENEERKKENEAFRDRLEADTRQLMKKIEEESSALRDSMESQGQELFDKIQQV